MSTSKAKGRREMGRFVNLISVQPPIATGNILATDTAELQEECLSMLEQAGSLNADFTGLPELVNVFGLSDGEARVAAEPERVDEFLSRVCEIAGRHEMYVLVPVLERRADGTYNSTKVIDRTGNVIGFYDKTHLIDFEAEWYGTVAGDRYPVFELDFGNVGIMTCYDCYFPEVARILAVQGAEVLFYPSWQSGPSEVWMEIQMRARAIDNCIYVMRSSFGYAPTVAWKPGMLFGRSCVIGPDGNVLADAGHYCGLAPARVDLDQGMLMDVLDDGGDPRDLKKLTLGDRRPETYQALTLPNRVRKRHYRVEKAAGANV